MKICVLGLGVIGTTYAYALQKSGCEVAHLLRDHKRVNAPNNLDINLLDGRYNKNGEEKHDHYQVTLAECDTEYDFILISVASGKLRAAVETVRNHHIKGTLILFCNLWDDKKDIEEMVQGYPYILAFPTAGGCFNDHVLNCVLFDHIMLEAEKKCSISNYKGLLSALSAADIKTEIPYDMVEWIWIHMAINAGVTSTAARNGGLNEPKKLAVSLMKDAGELSCAVKTIRETLKIVQARGVKLNLYKGEIMPYKLPAALAGIVMKKMFSANELTSRIMTLHNDVQDIMYGCKCVYNTGKEYQLDLPLFYGHMDKIIAE